MERMKTPPELTGDNYPYWKARTKMHLKALSDRIWTAVLTGWEHPKKVGATENDPKVLKPEVEWDAAERTLAGYNHKALDTIYSLMHESQFTLVAGCESAKEAWDILETTYEGTDSVRQSKLQLVHSDFEDLRMNENENITSFNERVQELANRAAVLGEPFPQQKLVKKVLRSLPPRFRMKVTAMQENAGWEDKTLAALIGSLKTYEMEILTDHTKKEKSVAFNAEGQDFDVPDTDELSDDPVGLLSKHFSNFLKHVKQKRYTQNTRMQNQKGTNSSSSKGVTKPGGSTSRSSGSRSGKSKDKVNKGIRCFECEGFGHVQAECPTYLRSKKSMTALTWSDDEPESEAADSDTDEISGNFVAFTAIADVEPDAEELAGSDNGEYNSAEDRELPPVSYEVEYKKLYSRWEALFKVHHSLSSKIAVLEDAKMVYKNQASEKDLLLKASLEREEKLQQELDMLKRRIKMMDTTSTLDEILDSGRQTSTKFGLGFSGGKNKDTVFVRSSEPVHNASKANPAQQSNMTASKPVYDTPESSSASQRRVTESGSYRVFAKPNTSRRGYGNVWYPNFHRMRYNPICHYCRMRGHTRPECYYFYKDQRVEKYIHKRIAPFVKQVWVRKADFITQKIPNAPQWKSGTQELVEDVENLEIQD